MKPEIGDKFIFEIDRIYSSKKQTESRYGIKGFENLVLSKRKINELLDHGNIERLSTHDSVTKADVDIAYEKGLEDAWKAARAYCCELNTYEIYRIFGYGVADDNCAFFEKHPQEVIEALMKYNESKENAKNVVIGDEVEAWDTNDWVRFIAWSNECGEITGIDENGGHYTYPSSCCRKTGRHFQISFTSKNCDDEIDQPWF